MKLKRRNREKKLISRIWILTAILALLIVVLFLSSEKANKIGIVDNVKKALTGQTDKILDDATNNQLDISNELESGIKTYSSTERTGIAPSDEYTKWNYELNDTTNIIKLKSYTSDIPEVVVYGSYEVNGKRYKTDISSLKFANNMSVSSIIFNSDVDTNNATDMSNMFYNTWSLTNLDVSNFDTSNVTNMAGIFYDCRSLTNLDVSSFNTSNVTNMNGMFSYCRSLTNLDVSNFDTGNVTNMSDMFSDCSSLTNLDVSNFDTSNVIDMRGMFGCPKLTNLDVSNFDTSNVRDMRRMFSSCQSLTNLDVSHFNTNRVKDMCGMFLGCSQLTNLDVSKFDTSNVLDMSDMFGGCRNLTNLDVNSFNTRYVNDMSSMFGGCSQLTNLDVSKFDTSIVTNMDGMFSGCLSLTNLDVSKFNTTNVGNMRNMFYQCWELRDLDVSNFETSNVIDMQNMFFQCSNLTNLNLGNKFNTSNVTNMQNMFCGCSNLINLNLGDKFDTRNISNPIYIEGMFNRCNEDLTVTYSAIQENAKFIILPVPKENFWGEDIYDCWYDQFNNKRYNDENVTYDSITLTLKPKIKVIWYSQDIILKTELVTIEEDIFALYPTNPVREGYKFVGWTSSGIDDEGNIAIIAEWEKIEIVPELPDDGRLYTITVENEMPEHTYNSYQVFGGNFSKREDDSGENVAILSNIVWGEEFQKLGKNETVKTYGDKLLEKLKEKNTTLYGECKTAEDVANVLVGKPKDGEEIREFAIIVGEFIKENNIPVTKGTSTQTTYTENGNTKTCYKITELNPGYYIVIDEKAELDENDAYSRYIIDVVQDVTVKPKSAIPMLEKKVIGNNLNKVITEMVSTGEGEETTEVTRREIDYTRNTAMYRENGTYDIKFELISSIPTQIDGYKEYNYKITDILSKGFDIDKNSIKITVGGVNYTEYIVEEPVKVTEENYETYKNYFIEKGTINPEDNYGKTIVLIKFNDLVPQIANKTILEGQEVIVTYNARLNGQGVTGKLSNENEAYLTYTASPYDGSKEGQTKPSITYTYTIELDLSKIAELKGENPVYEYLGGAKFEIYDEPEYIVNEEGKKVENKSRILIGTITSGNLELNKGQATYSSLKAGTYYLKEIEAPEGYNKLREEIEIKINAEYKDLTIVWSVEDKTNSKLVEAKIDETGNRVKLQVQNTSGLQLPITGGTGTLIFTIIGLSIMLITIICLKSNRKKKI